MERSRAKIVNDKTQQNRTANEEAISEDYQLKFIDERLILLVTLIYRSRLIADSPGKER